MDLLFVVILYPNGCILVLGFSDVNYVFNVHLSERYILALTNFLTIHFAVHGYAILIRQDLRLNFRAEAQVVDCMSHIYEVIAKHQTLVCITEAMRRNVEVSRDLVYCHFSNQLAPLLILKSIYGGSKNCILIWLLLSFE